MAVNSRLKGRAEEIKRTMTPTVERLITDAGLQQDLNEIYAMSDAIEARANLEAWSDAIKFVNAYWDGEFHD